MSNCDKFCGSVVSYVLPLATAKPKTFFVIIIFSFEEISLN